MHGSEPACKLCGGLHRGRTHAADRLGEPRQSPLWFRAKRNGIFMPKLFSYGTLQQDNVQLATFGRRLSGVSDALVGYRQSMAAIEDPEVVRTSGKTHHPIVAFTGKREE